MRLIAAASIVLAVATANAQDLTHGTDGEFDVSGMLATRGGFLPAPIIITEPAVGYGGGLAAIFFHGGNPLLKKDGRKGPPSITAVAAFATENGSKGGAVAHLGVWRDDHIRYIGIAGGASLNLDYWGTASRPLPEPFRYEVRGGLLIQRLLVRAGDSPVMLGGEWSYSTQKAEFRNDAVPPGVGNIDQKDSGVGVIGEYETLDNFFTARRGMKARVLAKTFSTKLGGDNNRERADVEGFGYVPFGDRWTLGIRTDFAFSNGDTPFYLLPYLDMRGLPALKYTGKHTALGELEARWNVHGRWSAVGFGGIGYAADSISDFSDAKPIGTLGGGFRYLIAERLGIHTGLDYARGPSDYAIYIVMGSAWR